MANRAPFVLPESLELDLDGAALSLRYDGDVHLQQSLGKPLGDVRATGDLTVAMDRVTGSLRAGGTLKITGDVDAQQLHGAVIELGSGKIRCRAISADERIVIGPATLTVNAIIAPEIVIDPHASGRVTVIECISDRGASKIKGGFSLVDYDDMFGNADEFLATMGLKRLTERQDRDDTSAVIEEVEDPKSLAAEDFGALEDDAPPMDPALVSTLDDALARVLSCYEGAETPPAVTDLISLVAGRDLTALREGILEVWNKLLGDHQSQGTRPHLQVTHAFKVIHELLFD